MAAGATRKIFEFQLPEASARLFEFQVEDLYESVLYFFTSMMND